MEGLTTGELDTKGGTLVNTGVELLSCRFSTGGNCVLLSVAVGAVSEEAVDCAVEGSVGGLCVDSAVETAVGGTEVVWSAGVDCE